MFCCVFVIYISVAPQNMLARYLVCISYVFIKKRLIKFQFLFNNVCCIGPTNEKFHCCLLHVFLGVQLYFIFELRIFHRCGFMYGELTDKETVTRLEYSLENQQQDQFEILLYKKNSKYKI